MSSARAWRAAVVPLLLVGALAHAGPEPEVVQDSGASEAGTSATPDGAVQAQDERSYAKRAFDDGLAAVAAGRYEDAVASFERAYDLQPHPGTLFNLALALEMAGRRAEAWELFDATLHVVESDGERREIRKHLRALEAEVAILEIQASPRHRLCIDGFDMPHREHNDYRLAVEPGTHELLLDEREFSLAVEPGDRRVVLLEGAEHFIEGEHRSPVVPGMLGLSIGSGAAAIGLGVGAAMTREPQLRTGLAAGAAGSAGLAVIAGVVALAIEVHERRKSSKSSKHERVPDSARCPGSSTRIDLQLVPKVTRPAKFAALPLPSMPTPVADVGPRLRGIRPPRRSEAADQQHAGSGRDHGDAAPQRSAL